MGALGSGVLITTERVGNHSARTTFATMLTFDALPRKAKIASVELDQLALEVLSRSWPAGFTKPKPDDIDQLMVTSW
jgi:hypothetical protein